MSGPYHINKYPLERHEGVDLSARLREELEHERYNVEKTAQEGARRIKELYDRVSAAMAWMEERAKNSTSFGSHCHAYEVAARHLKLALDGDDASSAPVGGAVRQSERS